MYQLWDRLGLGDFRIGAVFDSVTTGALQHSQRLRFVFFVNVQDQRPVRLTTSGVTKYIHIFLDMFTYPDISGYVSGVKWISIFGL